MKAARCYVTKDKTLSKKTLVQLGKMGEAIFEFMKMKGNDKPGAHYEMEYYINHWYTIHIERVPDDKKMAGRKPGDIILVARVIAFDFTFVMKYYKIYLEDQKGEGNDEGENVQQ